MLAYMETGAVKLSATSCLVDKPFVFNERFRIISGHRYMTTGNDLDFGPTPEHPPVSTGSDRSRVCNSFSSAAVIYAKTDHNLARALRRQTAVREDKFMMERDLPPRADYEQLMLSNMIAFVKKHGHKLIEYSAKAHIEWFTMIEEADEHAADPHPKRSLRISALDDVYERGLAHKKLWQVKMFRIKLKLDEMARPGKYGRTIGDFGAHASLQGAFYTGHCKHFLDCNYFEHAGSRCKFIGACTAEALDEMFHNMLTETEYRLDHAIFSDDSLFVVHVNGVKRFFDVDIASCDVSHREPMFNHVVEMFPDDNVMECLVAQCSAPLLIQSVSPEMCPDTGRPKQVVIEPVDGPILSSGSTLTTTINTVAVKFLFIAFSLVPDSEVSVESYQKAAESVGYHCTINEVFRPCDLRFLRRQPVLDEDGRYRAMLVPGTMFRTLGITKSDLPNKRLTMLERGQIFQGQLIQGFYSDVSCPFLDFLKKLYPFKEPSLHVETMALTRKRPIVITDEAFFESYDPTSLEIASLYASILDNYHTIGVINNPLASRAIFKEYGI